MSVHSILLIDPFKNLLNAYRMVLEEEKYSVETALNLKEAYEFLNKKEYCVIITEYIPPFETTDYLIKWAKGKTPETYIIVVSSAFVDEKTYGNLFDIGVDDFILKPYSPEKILVHVRKGLKLRDLIQNPPIGENERSRTGYRTCSRRCFQSDLFQKMPSPGA